MHETSVGLLALLALWPVLGSAARDVPAEAVELEEIVIGGSRIVREDYRSASPIVTVSEQLFEQTGAVTVETVLNSLPQFVPSITNTSNNPSNSGQANVELRGLGAERTLVLLDGRRIVPANGTGVVDLNLLPASVIGSVEITSGGASAVYGSDALAGVVNFRTRDFEGLEIESNWGRTTSGDGDAWQTSITAGSSFADGRTHGLLVLTYADREAVRQADREFTRVALGYDRDRGFVPLGSPTIEEGRVIVPASQQAFDALFVERYGAAPAGSPLQTAFGFNPDGSLFTTGDGSSGSVLNFRGPREAGFNDAAYTYNFAPPNYL
ncbi:MAG TPA: TonB-dependent receptor plug domain-containing protein, partial [Steroidobacteraceae bacterium]|nr:TonB-dependent receptor plug domain-containing protein [Steroidobacteraceae bacterium]